MAACDPEVLHTMRSSVAHNTLRKVVLQDTLLWDIKTSIILARWRFSFPYS